MKSIGKSVLRTFGGLAVATGLVVGGAGVASAAPTAPAAHSASAWHPFCNPFQRERWNFNGSNTVNAVFQGKTFPYSVTFRQFGSCLHGSLTDPFFGTSGTTGPILGTVNGNDVTFAFQYPAGSVQGTRTFTGTVQPVWFRLWFRHHHHWVFRWVFRLGAVSGTWSETGSENGSGTFTLAKLVHRACPWWFFPGASCRVFP